MADAKITELTALTSVDSADVLAIVDDPAGTPVTKKITVANLTAGSQPLDSDLTAIAALTTTTIGRSLLATADAAAIRTIAAAASTAHAATHGSGSTDPVKLGNLWIGAGAMLASITTGAVGPTQIESTTNDQNHMVMDFANGSTLYAHFACDMPTDYDGGTFTAEFEWTNANTTANVCRWQIEARAYTDLQTIDQAYGTAVAVDDTYSTTAYQFARSAATAAVTAGGSPTGGCRMAFRIARLGGHANDTLTTDARLLGVRIVYQRT